MKSKYRASDIILVILGFVIVSVLYYLGNFYGFAAGAVFAMLYAIIMNRRILGEVVNKIKRYYYSLRLATHNGLR